VRLYPDYSVNKLENQFSTIGKILFLRLILKNISDAGKA
jgi:hypothetical protein